MNDAEYGPTVIPSTVDTETNEKRVNSDAKELIAKCISQCKQADVSYHYQSLFISIYLGLWLKWKPHDSDK